MDPDKAILVSQNPYILYRDGKIKQTNKTIQW